MRKLAIGATAAVLASCTQGCIDLGGDDMVESYCRYGAVSRAQLEGCIDHVTEADVRSLQTHASQYAFGDLDRCLADAGPFCKPRD
jgi:hypothetical protein